jgi:hypothetical protein
MNDLYEGQGGSYLIDERGERQLLERTRDAGEAPPDPPAPAEPAAQDKPAHAGFFSPADDAADHLTTTE